MEAIGGSRIHPQMSLNLNSKSLHHHVKFIPSFLSTSKLTVDRRSKNSVSVKRKSISGKIFCSNGSFASESQVAEEKIGVLLLNLGAPDTYDDVQPFLFNMFSDPDIIRLPRFLHFLQRPLAWLLSTLRAPKSKEAYASISGGSPLKKMTNEQAYELELGLSDLEFPANVYVAMRYWHPFTEEAVHQIKRDNITRLVVLPLYPQYSISTTGSSVRVLHEMFRDDAHLSSLPVAIIKSWSHRDDYISCFVNSISDTLQYFSNPDEVTIFFTAHGVPMNYVDNAGDPYRDQVEECVFLIMEELNGNGHTLAYQSLVGPLQWLKPCVDEVLDELSQQGVKSILSVPVSFVSEHIETLEEVRNEYYDLAYELGITDWGGVGYQHNISSFAITLANAVIEALPSAMPISNSNSSSSATSTYKSEKDNVGYGIKMIFDSIFAFLPKVVSAFTNRVL